MQYSLGKYTFYFSRKKIFYLLLFYFILYFTFCLPKKLFHVPTSTIILSKNGTLLNARIADDGQWRFPLPDSIPEKFKTCLIAYEDHDFYQHIGISMTAIARAITSNIKAGKIVSGASTITMQIARMARDQDRTYWQKLIEAIWALRLEIRYSKTELLQLYVAHAPFGGNVVGLEAASWRYYELPPYKLSWSQCATLAVLPNAPGLVYPGKNRPILLKKRNQVLQYLHKIGKIDAITLELALEEPLIGPPKPLPHLATQLMLNAIKKGKKGQRIQTTINFDKQKEFTDLMARHQNLLNQKYIHNAALLVINIHTKKVVTYIGNTAIKNKYQQFVDCAQAPRSTGSILKPFLYAALLQEGKISNASLIPDVPMHFEHFSPENYDKTYSGAVPAGKALSQSLNIPAVFLLQKYGIKRFLFKLGQLGQKHINKSANYYGLSLILGGAETTLWDLANSYAGMVKTLNYYNRTNHYNPITWSPITLYPKPKKNKQKDLQNPAILDAGGIFKTFEALLDVHRPRMESSWRNYTSSTKIAWKTGTSFGNRDAWAIGCTPDYVIAVWVGNATGEGRPSLVGATAAGPILFDVFSHLPNHKSWFETPYDALQKVSICRESGYRSTSLCTQIDTIDAPRNFAKSLQCHFHRIALTSANKNMRYFQNCNPNLNLYRDTFFVLPPSQAYFYAKHHPLYRQIPPLAPNCRSFQKINSFQIIYPQHGSEIIGTKGLNGDRKGIIFIATDPNPDATLFWHVDNQFIGKTKQEHHIKYVPKKGKHLLTVVDQNGSTKKISFTILAQ